MPSGISIGLIIMTSVLVFERITKYYLDHVKKSKCCGGEIEFESNNTIKKKYHDSNEIELTHRRLPSTPQQQRKRTMSDPNIY